MSTETCKLCNQDSTPWVHINGHICQDCYENTKILFNPEKPVWISVKDRLPEIGISVLLCGNDEEQDYCFYVGWIEKLGIENKPCWQYSWCCGCYCKNEITHWAKLPESPK